MTVPFVIILHFWPLLSIASDPFQTKLWWRYPLSFIILKLQALSASLMSSHLYNGISTLPVCFQKRWLNMFDGFSYHMPYISFQFVSTIGLWKSSGVFSRCLHQVHWCWPIYSNNKLMSKLKHGRRLITLVLWFNYRINSTKIAPFYLFKYQ